MKRKKIKQNKNDRIKQMLLNAAGTHLLQSDALPPKMRTMIKMDTKIVLAQFQNKKERK